MADLKAQFEKARRTSDPAKRPGNEDMLTPMRCSSRAARRRQRLAAGHAGHGRARQVRRWTKLKGTAKDAALA